MSVALDRIINGSYQPPQRKSGRRLCQAFADESGSAGGRSDSRFFVLGAAVVDEEELVNASEYLGAMRASLGRQPGCELHFKNLKAKRGHRALAAQLLVPTRLTFVAVATDKTAFSRGTTWNHVDTYHWTITLLLERLSWLARRRGRDAELTLAHKRHMKSSKLRGHEELLRSGGGSRAGHRIDWEHFRESVKIGTPKTVEMLQYADMFVSMVGAALNGEGDARTLNPGYVSVIEDRIMSTGWGRVCDTGLKVHPKGSVPDWLKQM